MVASLLHQCNGNGRRLSGHVNLSDKALRLMTTMTTRSMCIQHSTMKKEWVVVDEDIMMV
jgi:hypothetical protein